MTSTRYRALLAAAAALGPAVLAIAPAAFIPGCSKPSAPLPPPDQTYTVRGRIESLPVASQPASELNILHEPIPTFVNMQGKVQAMDSMIMPFTPAPGVSLAGLRVGDPVEFTFEVRWKSRPSSRLTSIRKLPADTPLHIGKAEGGR